ncbi:MAG: nitronate monooxygenase [Dehalococcoidia bacterium]|nr:nitronate monooxygenase [Dehalococcoidia bacterium]
MQFDNPVTRMLGVEIPILQAPMGYIAKPDLVAAVSEAGAMGLVPGSLGIEEVRADIRRVRELTSKPFGINLPIAFIRDVAIVDMIVEEGVRFVTTSAGSPDTHTARLKDAGLTVFHVVPTLRAAQKAVAAGVDGLVVEGSEGAGFKNPREVSTMVLLPLIASQLGVPIIAAGGIADGRSMAAAFALGAEGVQMGTRMVATKESPVHENMKLAIVAAAETDTLMLNKERGKPVRVLRTQTTSAMEFDNARDAMELLGDIAALYERGDLEASLAQCGQVAGRIDAIVPAGEIIRKTVEEFDAVLRGMANHYLGTPTPA